MRILFLLMLVLSLASFGPPTKTEKQDVYYAFVTDTEHDEAYDEPGNNGYVDITTNIVTVNCDASANTIVSQYIEHYAAEEMTGTRDRAFIGSPGITNAWIYDTEDEALASRREWMANANSKHKRRVEGFFVTCD